MSDFDSKLNRSAREVFLTAIYWIVLPFLADAINQIRLVINSSNLNFTNLEQQNQIIDFLIGVLLFIRPNLELAIIELILILIGVIFSIIRWSALRGSIITILGISLALFLTNYSGLDLSFENSPIDSPPQTPQESETKNIHNPDINTDPQKFVCYDSQSKEVSSLMTNVLKEITYGCHLMVDDLGIGHMSCSSDSSVFEFESLRNFETYNANLISINEQTIIQFKQKGQTLTCVQ